MEARIFWEISFFRGFGRSGAYFDPFFGAHFLEKSAFVGKVIQGKGVLFGDENVLGLVFDPQKKQIFSTYLMKKSSETLFDP